MSPVMLPKKDSRCGGVFSHTTGSGLNAVHRKLELKPFTDGKRLKGPTDPTYHVGRFAHTFTVKQHLHCTDARAKQTLRPLVQNVQ